MICLYDVDEDSLCVSVVNLTTNTVNKMFFV